MQCSEITDLLSAYIDDVLDDADRAAVENHIRTCGACYQELLDLQETVLLLRSLGEVSPPADFRERLMERLEKETGSLVNGTEKKKSWLYKVTAGSWKHLAAAVLIVGLGVGTGVYALNTGALNGYKVGTKTETGNTGQVALNDNRESERADSIDKEKGISNDRVNNSIDNKIAERTYSTDNAAVRNDSTDGQAGIQSTAESKPVESAEAGSSAGSPDALLRQELRSGSAPANPGSRSAPDAGAGSPPMGLMAAEPSSPEAGESLEKSSEPGVQAQDAEAQENDLPLGTGRSYAAYSLPGEEPPELLDRAVPEADLPQNAITYNRQSQPDSQSLSEEKATADLIQNNSTAGTELARREEAAADQYKAKPQEEDKSGSSSAKVSQSVYAENAQETEEGDTRDVKTEADKVAGAVVRDDGLTSSRVFRWGGLFILVLGFTGLTWYLLVKSRKGSK